MKRSIITCLVTLLTLFCSSTKLKALGADDFVIEVASINTISGVSVTHQLYLSGFQTLYYENVANPAVNGTINVSGINGNYALTLPYPTAPSGINYVVRLTPKTGVTSQFRFRALSGDTAGRSFANLYRVHQWGTAVWRSLEDAFNSCEVMHVVATDIPNLSQCTSLARTFSGCKILNAASSDPPYTLFNSWNTTTVTNMSGTFQNCASFNEPLSNWNTSNVTNMSQMFASANSFNQPLHTWNTSNVTNMTGMFASAYVFNQYIGNWDTANVTSMSQMFQAAYAFNQDISYKGGNVWNTSNVTSMANMFAVTKVFNQPIGNWDTSNVTSMTSMFAGADSPAVFTPFNQAIGGWNVAKVTDMSHMFDKTLAFNQDLGLWNTSMVTNMEYMFSKSQAFNHPSIANWNTGAVTNFFGMFYQAKAFNQPLNTWNTASATNMRSMFEQAAVFNQPLYNWNTANVTTMTKMFSGNPAFNQNLGSWNIGNIRAVPDPFGNMSDIFSNTSMSIGNIDATLMCWSSQTVKSGVKFSAAGRSYCRAQNAINTLTSKGWNMSATGMTPSCPWEAGIPGGKIFLRAGQLYGYSANTGLIRFAGNAISSALPLVDGKIGYDTSLGKIVLQQGGQKYELATMACAGSAITIPGKTPTAGKITYYNGEFYYANGSGWFVITGG